MSSSPPRSAQNTPSRTPLQERTQSQANEISSRLVRNLKQDNSSQNVYTTSPFPTKAQHVLLPSNLRKQKSARNLGADIFSPEYRLRSSSDVQIAPTTPRQPAVRLKKSVKTLRDMYEAQSEDSRPSSSAGVRSRPGSSSSRLRSFSSNEGLAGRVAWEALNKNRASDDMALLPPLPEGQSTLRQIGSKSSFAARSGMFDPESSPNYQILGATSSPRAPEFRPLAELSSDPPEEPPTDPGSIEQSSFSTPTVMRYVHSSRVEELPSVDESSSPNFVKLSTSSPDRTVPRLAPASSEEELRSDDPSSSPNFVKLGTSSPARSVLRLAPASSEEELPSDDPSSSPNFIKLGTSSPARTLRAYESSSPLQRPASNGSESPKKRKRSDPDEGYSRAGAVNPFASSSPQDDSNASQESFRSSPPAPPVVYSKSVLIPSPDASSVLDSPYRYSIYADEQSSMAETHSNLQAALTSSPAPPIQYPVVRAPASVQIAGLVVPKRKNRSSLTSETLNSPRWPSRLSAVPSDASLRSRDTSKRSSIWDEPLEPDADLLPAAYMMSEEATASQIRIISDSERHEEADDEVGALPGDEYGYRSPPIVRTNSFGNTPGSSRSRLNSLQSSIENRKNSLTSRRGSLRRSSSAGSLVVTAVPTWARRYYSGFYQDSFRYLMQSSSSVNVTQVAPPVQKPLPLRPESIDTTMSASTPRSSRRSFASIRQSLEKIPSLIRAGRPRLEARKSHTMPGLGPLVSHPVRGPATAAMSGARSSQTNLRSQVRPVSLPLHPADPRSQWAGHNDMYPSAGINSAYPRSMHQSTLSAPLPSVGMPYHIPPRRMGRLSSASPHLHHDHRLNTGSTASRGYGRPFTHRKRHSNPSDMLFDDAAGPAHGHPLRTGQVICFILGFMCPLAWFVGAVLPLPKRPDTFMDIEKGTWRRASRHGDLTEYEAMNVLAGLRQEKRLRGGEEAAWQNARWWRRLNRWMCIIGTIVLVLVIVLAVVGTTTNGLS